MNDRDEIITTIRPIGRWEVLDVRQILAFRDLFFALGRRDIQLRYRQTVLGVAWVILQPLTAAAIFAFVFGIIAKVQAPNGLPYFLFAFVGMLGWSLFSGTLTKAASSLVQNSALVSKVCFPKSIVPLSAMFAGIADLLVGLLLLLILIPVFGLAFSWQMALLPVWIALLLVASLGLGLYCSALMVSYRDMQFVLPVFVQLFFYASPVAYDLSQVPAKWQWIVVANPLTGVLEGMRWSLLGTAFPNTMTLAYSAGTILLTFLLGALLFGKAERRFADVI